MLLRAPHQVQFISTSRVGFCVGDPHERNWDVAYGGDWGSLLTVFTTLPSLHTHRPLHTCTPTRALPADDHVCAGSSSNWPVVCHSDRCRPSAAGEACPSAPPVLRVHEQAKHGLLTIDGAVHHVIFIAAGWLIRRHCMMPLNVTPHCQWHWLCCPLAVLVPLAVLPLAVLVPLVLL